MRVSVIVKLINLRIEKGGLDEEEKYREEEV